MRERRAPSPVEPIPPGKRREDQGWGVVAALLVVAVGVVVAVAVLFLLVGVVAVIWGRDDPRLVAEAVARRWEQLTQLAGWLVGITGVGSLPLVVRRLARPLGGLQRLFGGLHAGQKALPGAVAQAVVDQLSARAEGDRAETRRLHAEQAADIAALRDLVMAAVETVQAPPPGPVVDVRDPEAASMWPDPLDTSRPWVRQDTGVLPAAGGPLVGDRVRQAAANLTPDPPRATGGRSWHDLAMEAAGFWASHGQDRMSAQDAATYQRMLDAVDAAADQHDQART